MEGWLYKKGTWQRYGEKRRWFSMDPDKRELSYFKVMQIKKSVGSMRMGTINLAEAVSIEDKLVAKGTFEIVTKHHVYELRTEDPAEAPRWVHALKPLLGRDKTPPKAGKAVAERPALRYAPPDLCQPAVPWAVTAVWLDGDHHGSENHKDAELHIVAELGSVSKSELRTRVLLSDATTMMIDAGEHGLHDGKFHEVATAGSCALLARLSCVDGGDGAQPKVEEVRAADLPPPAATAVIGPFLAGLGIALFCVAWMPSLMVQLALPLVLAVSAAALYVMRGDLMKVLPRRGGASGAASSAANSGPAHHPSWRLELKSVLQGEMEVQAVPKGSKTRLSHPQRQLSRQGSAQVMNIATTTQPAAAGGSAASVADFTGTWTLNLSHSDDPSDMLKALKVPYAARLVLKRASRQVVIEHDGLEWAETNITPVIRRQSNMLLDGTPCVETNPVDGSSVTMVSTIEENGACVMTKGTYADGRVHWTRRYLRDGGKTYHVLQKLENGSEVISCNNYFEREQS